LPSSFIDCIREKPCYTIRAYAWIMLAVQSRRSRRCIFEWFLALANQAREHLMFLPQVLISENCQLCLPLHYEIVPPRFWGTHFPKMLLSSILLSTTVSDTFSKDSQPSIKHFFFLFVISRTLSLSQILQIQDPNLAQSLQVCPLRQLVASLKKVEW
jgi:hypothetical protein